MLERLRKIESVYGPVNDTNETTGHRVELDSTALEFFRKHRYGDNVSLPIEKQQQYYKGCSKMGSFFGVTMLAQICNS